MKNHIIHVAIKEIYKQETKTPGELSGMILQGPVYEDDGAWFNIEVEDRLTRKRWHVKVRVDVEFVRPRAG